MVSSAENPVTEAHLSSLKAVVRKGPVLITTHHNPDPDGLASGEAFAFLLKELWNIPSCLVYTGIVSRAENRAMLKHLTYNWEPLDSWEILKSFPVVCLVDNQPGSGNNEIPQHCNPRIVFDHHTSFITAQEEEKYIDIRPVGAVSTMMYQYLGAAGLKASTILATALFYGLKTDTRGLSRGRSKYDERAYFELLSLVDHSLLSLIEQAQLPLIYFQAMNDALMSTKVFGKVVITELESIHQPDLPAEIADLLIRLEGADTALCMGVYKNKINLSLRMRREDVDAGMIINKVVRELGMSGGHKTMAGGQIFLHNKDKDEITGKLVKRFLKEMGEKAPGTDLLINQV